MKQQELFKKIGGIINELNDQYEYLVKEPGKLNELELELFVANANFLKDHAEILLKINAQAVITPAEEKVIEAEKVTEAKYFEPLVQKVKPADIKFEVEEAVVADTKPVTPEFDDSPVPHINLHTGSSDDSYSYMREEEPEPVRHELVLDDNIDWDEDEDEIYENQELTEPENIHPVAIKVKEQPAEVKEQPVAVITPEPMVKEPADDKVLTINQKMSAQLKEKLNITEHAVGQPINDLKSAITLNDKLLFVGDLFGGYSLAYSEVIDILNRSKDFAEADKFLKTNYTVKYDWEKKPDTVYKFYALLKRRYA